MAFIFKKNKIPSIEESEYLNREVGKPKRSRLDYLKPQKSDSVGVKALKLIPFFIVLAFLSYLVKNIDYIVSSITIYFENITNIF